MRLSNIFIWLYPKKSRWISSGMQSDILVLSLTGIKLPMILFLVVYLRKVMLLLLLKKWVCLPPINHL